MSGRPRPGCGALAWAAVMALCGLLAAPVRAELVISGGHTDLSPLYSGFEDLLTPPGHSGRHVPQWNPASRHRTVGEPATKDGRGGSVALWQKHSAGARRMARPRAGRLQYRLPAPYRSVRRPHLWRDVACRPGIFPALPGKRSLRRPTPPMPGRSRSSGPRAPWATALIRRKRPLRLHCSVIANMLISQPCGQRMAALPGLRQCCTCKVYKQPINQATRR